MDHRHAGVGEYRFPGWLLMFTNHGHQGGEKGPSVIRKPDVQRGKTTDGCCCLGAASVSPGLTRTKTLAPF